MGSRAASKRLKQTAFALAITLVPLGASAQIKTSEQIATGAQHCSENHVLVQGGFGEARFTIDLADDPSERAQGLMHVATLASSAGMLFVYEAPQRAAFWMKNTLIPLDMIFVDHSGLIKHIHENAIPHDETPILGGENIYAVLEINAGLSNRFGFQVGDSLVHPAFFDADENKLCTP